jgi:hypothetical protein
VAFASILTEQGKGLGVNNLMKNEAIRMLFFVNILDQLKTVSKILKQFSGNRRNYGRFK